MENINKIPKILRIPVPYYSEFLLKCVYPKNINTVIQVQDWDSKVECKFSIYEAHV